MGLLEVGWRPARGMIGMRVVEADDVEVALAGLALHPHQFARIDVVAVLGRIDAGVAAADGGPHLAGVASHNSQQYPTALVRVGLLAVAADLVEVGLVEFQHAAVFITFSLACRVGLQCATVVLSRPERWDGAKRLAACGPVARVESRFR